MKHIKHAQDKATDSKIYRYTLGFMLLLKDIIVKTLKLAFKYITELLMVIALISMVVTLNAFDYGAINYTTAILFIAILAVLVVSLIKIKILEVKKK